MAALSAACRSPPATTLNVVVGGRAGGTKVAVMPATLKPPVSNTSFISCGPAAMVAVSVICVQVCQLPVFGTIATSVSVEPNRA